MKERNLQTFSPATVGRVKEVCQYVVSDLTAMERDNVVIHV